MPTISGFTTVADLVDGADGSNAGAVFIFNRSSTAPSTPADTTGVTQTQLNNNSWTAPTGWSKTPPTGTDTLYISSASFSGDPNWTFDWSAPIQYEGSDGTAGDTYRTIYLFQNGTSSPTAPANTAGFTASTGVAAATGSWVTSPTTPSSGQTIYVATMTLVQTNSTGNYVSSSGWSVGAAGARGTPGPRFASRRLYATTAVTGTIQAPSATITWSSGALSNINDNDNTNTISWSETAPTVTANSSNRFLYSDLLFIDTTGTATTTTDTGSTPLESINFEGLVTFSSGDFSVNGSTITSIDGGNITTGTIGADQIAAGAITARQLSVAEVGARTVVGNWTEGSDSTPDADGELFFSTSTTSLTRPATGAAWNTIQRCRIYRDDSNNRNFQSIFSDLVRAGSVIEFNQLDSNGLITRGAEFEVLSATYASNYLDVTMRTEPTADVGTFSRGATYTVDIAPNVVNVLRVGDLVVNANAEPTSGSGTYISSNGDVTFGTTQNFLRWDESAGELEIRGEIINFSPAFFNGNDGNWGQINTSQTDLSNVLDGAGFYVFAIIGNGGEGGGSRHSDNTNIGGSGGGGGGVAIVGYEWDGSTALACTISKDDGSRVQSGNSWNSGNRGGSFTFSEGGSTVLTITGAQAGGSPLFGSNSNPAAGTYGGSGGGVSGNWVNNATHLINSYFQGGGSGGIAERSANGHNATGGGGGAVDIGQVVQNNNSISNTNGLSGGRGSRTAYSGGGGSIWGPGIDGSNSSATRRDSDNKSTGVNISGGANYFGIAPGSIYGGTPRSATSTNGEAGGTFSGGSGARGSLYTNNADNPARVAVGGNGGTWGGGGGGASASGGSTDDSGSYPGAINAPSNNGGTGVILWYKL